ncbi:hypothetical protein ACU8NX_18560 [Rhizobium leguminosarum]
MSDRIEGMSRFEFKRDPANGMLVGPDGCHHDTEAQAMYFDQLGFCGCGSPEEVHKFVCDCLGAFDREKQEPEWHDAIELIKETVTNDPENAAYFIAYVLDTLNLTEHGGTVGGAWLSDRGKQFLEIGPMEEE